MNISEFRQQHPEYNDLADDVLADKLHGKFYSDMPKEEFTSKFMAGAKPLSVGEVVTGAVKSFPSSAAQYGKALVAPVIHPVETAKALGDIAAGGIEKATGAELQPEAKSFDAMVEMLKNRYGSMEAVKKTIATDPVGFMSDLSTVLGGAGAVLKAGGLAKTAEVATAAAGVTDPINIAKAAGAVVVKAIPESLPGKLYGSAVKFSTTLEPAERARRIETGIREGILPTREGLETLQSKIEDVNQAIKDKIVEAARGGETINTQDIAKRVDELKPFYENTVNPQPYLSDLDQVKKVFEEAHGQTIPVDKAQQIKRNTYALLRKQYGELKSHSVEAQKALARGIKEELAARFPVLNELNKRDSELISLEKSIERSVSRIENRDLVGIGSTIAGTAGAAISGEPHIGFMSMLAKGLLDHPKVKAQIAISLRKAMNKSFSVRYDKAAKIRQATFQAGRAEETTNP